MKTIAAMAALTGAFAIAPLLAANGDEYQFIISGDPIAAATVDSSSDGAVFEESLEARYRTCDESVAHSLRSDDSKGAIIIVM